MSARTLALCALLSLLAPPLELADARGRQQCTCVAVAHALQPLLEGSIRAAQQRELVFALHDAPPPLRLLLGSRTNRALDALDLRPPRVLLAAQVTASVDPWHTYASRSV